MLIKKDQINITALDVRILNKIWNVKSINVREIHESIIKEDFEAGKERDILPYTSVASKMKEFAKAGIVKIDKSQKTFIISPVINKADFINQMVDLFKEILSREGR